MYHTSTFIEMRKNTSILYFKYLIELFLILLITARLKNISSYFFFRNWNLEKVLYTAYIQKHVVMTIDELEREYSQYTVYNLHWQSMIRNR